MEVIVPEENNRAAVVVNGTAHGTAHGTALQATQATNVIEAIRPLCADDGHKGTFIILRIAGLGQGAALKIINRKFRSWQNWRQSDGWFKELDDGVPELSNRFGGEARVIRTALLDIEIIEAGIAIFNRILVHQNSKQPVSDGMWAYATKMAGLRIPMMGAEREVGSPWERLANSIKQTMNQRELRVEEGVNGSRVVTAREVKVVSLKEQPLVTSDELELSLEQKRMAKKILEGILVQVREDGGEIS